MSNESHGKTPGQLSAPIITINGRRSHAADGRRLEHRATPNPSVRPAPLRPAMSSAVIVSAIGSDAEAKRQSWAEKKRVEREATVARLRADARLFQDLSPLEGGFFQNWSTLFVFWVGRLIDLGVIARAAEAVHSRSGSLGRVPVEMLQAVIGGTGKAVDEIETFLREQTAEAVDAIEFWRDSETVEAVLAAAFPEKSDAAPIQIDPRKIGTEAFGILMSSPPPQPAGSERRRRPRRPCEQRDDWFRQQSAKGLRHFEIRDAWNRLTDAERKAIARDAWHKLPPKGGSDTVRKAVGKAVDRQTTGE